MQQFSLKLLEEHLNSKEYPSIYHDRSDEIPFPSLVLFLGNDLKGRERTIEIMLKEQLDFPTQESDLASKQYTLHFRYIFPFEPSEENLIDTIRLVSYLNYNFEVPGLEIDEVTNRLQYRYVSFGLMNNPSLDTAYSIVGVLVMFIELFSEPLEMVASGKMSMNELLEKALFAMESVTS